MSISVVKGQGPPLARTPDQTHAKESLFEPRLRSPSAPRPSPATVLGADPPRSAPSQVLQVSFLYLTGLAIGLHLALVHLYLWGSPRAFFFFLGATLLSCTVILGLWIWVLPRFANLRFPLRLAAQILTSAVAIAALSFLTVEANSFLFGGHSILNPYNGPDRTITIPASALRHAPVIYFLIPIVPTAILCVVGFNLHWWRILVMQARARALEDAAASAQLAALRAQIHPHFFFNSLNSIAQLIRIHPDQAERCVERLAEVFRYLLSRSGTEFVPLDEELRFAHAYLEIETARFGDELTVEWDVEPAARRQTVPSLILQPLVENAVKHGISKKIDGGTLVIRARVRERELQIEVEDTGVGITDDGRLYERGLGLRSVRDRLVRLYGERHAPEIDSVAGQGTTVRLRFPLQSHHEAAR
ncbi:MAG: histidine kinase [Candidatus Binatia bacterium]|nr:histidine kinase [Candidatus Binatia bacterium]